MENELIDLLRTVTNNFQGRLKEQIVAKEPGISTFQARLITLIGRHDGVSQLALGSFTERDKAQITRTVKELEMRGWVTRSVKTTDKRSKFLSLTVEGQALYLRLRQLREQLAIEILGSLNDVEKSALQTSLQKIAVHL